jgi:hypothetical protein
MSGGRLGAGHGGKGVGCPPGPVLLDGEGLQPGEHASGVVDEADGGDIGLDDVDLLQWGDDQALRPSGESVQTRWSKVPQL